jgi:hypothetical protein
MVFMIHQMEVHPSSKERLIPPRPTPTPTPTTMAPSSLMWHHQQPQRQWHRQVIRIQAPLLHLHHCHLHEENRLMMKSRR